MHARPSLAWSDGQCRLNALRATKMSKLVERLLLQTFEKQTVDTWMRYCSGSLIKHPSNWFFPESRPCDLSLSLNVLMIIVYNNDNSDVKKKKKKINVNANLES